LDVQGNFHDVFLSSSGDIATGYAISDSNVCVSGNPEPCSVTGIWTETFIPTSVGSASGGDTVGDVPEPATFAMLGTGLLGLAAIRGSRARHLAGEA
jgi:hypothetical protein